MKTRFHLIAASLFLVFTASASADGGFFITAGGYQAQVSESDLDESDTVFGATFGYMFGDYFGLEGGYYDLGDYEDGASSLSVDAFSAAAIGAIPIGYNFVLYGKLGVAAVSASGTILGIDVDEDGAEPYGGIGAELKGDKVGVFLEVNRFTNDIADVDVAGIGVKIRF